MLSEKLMCHGQTLELSLTEEGQRLLVWIKDVESGKEIFVAESIDTHYLSTEVAGEFVDCTIGIYAMSTNKADYADFKWLKQKIIS